MSNEIETLFGKILNSRRLFYASLELTFNCNFACKFCYNPIEREGQERKKNVLENEKPLAKDEIFDLLKQLRECGVLYFTLTGGEPLVHPHFWEIARKCKELAFVLRIFSNGALIGEKEVKKLSELCPNCLEISLYGASEKSYENSCGRGDSFNKVIKALNLLKKEGINVYLKCMLTSATENEMDEIQDIADNLGFPLNWDPHLEISDDGEDYPLKMRASKKAIERLYNESKFKVGSSPFEGGERISTCNIGKNLIHIDPYGNIFPCVEWRESIGNVKRDKIKDLWENSEKLFNLMKLSKDSVKEMGKTNFFCIAREIRKKQNSSIKFKSED